ncbi:unnamed protein product [Triticum turgidum subsp. durum]|uniref:Secreted protein n=1 Tax=Triticum turgidum subsp. durum TaxID=4567 RepID=A0A9R1C0W5_TRITD|nr:unnamed protein product [Triticum turgidum subsp. durum]
MRVIDVVVGLFLFARCCLLWEEVTPVLSGLTEASCAWGPWLTRFCHRLFYFVGDCQWTRCNCCPTAQRKRLRAQFVTNWGTGKGNLEPSGKTRPSCSSSLTRRQLPTPACAPPLPPSYSGSGEHESSGSGWTP